MYSSFLFSTGTGDPLTDSINRLMPWGKFLCCNNLTKKYWNHNLSEASNRANILNILDKEDGKEPYYPMLPNGELDIEALKLKREKEEKERHEEQMRLEAERKAYEKSFGGRLEKFLTFLWSLTSSK